MDQKGIPVSFLAIRVLYIATIIGREFTQTANDPYMSTRLTHHFYRIITIGNSDTNTDNSAQMIKLAIDGQWGPLVTLQLEIK